MPQLLRSRRSDDHRISFTQLEQPIDFYVKEHNTETPHHAETFAEEMASLNSNSNVIFREAVAA